MSDPETLQPGRDTLLSGTPIQPSEFEPQGCIVIDRSVQKERLLKNARHAAPDRQGVFLCYLVAVKVNLAFRWLLEQPHEAKKRRLSRAIGSDDGENLAWIYG